MEVIWQAFKRLLHAVVLIAIFVLLLVIAVDLVVLGWSWWPVSRASMDFGSASAIFIIVPLPVGEATVSGLQALVAAGVLAIIGAALHAIRRSRALPGLGGGGTALMSALTLLAAVGMAVLGAGLASEGNMWDAAAVPSIIPSPLGLMVVRFTLLAQWHSIMIGGVLMSAVALVLVDGPPLVRMLRKSARDATLPPVRTDNAFIMIPRMYMGIVGFYVVYFALLSLFTVEPQVPDFEAMPLWEQLHAFAEASVWEEVLSRVLTLGVPLMVFHIWTRRDVSERWRYLVGGGFSIDTAAFVLIVFQALVFALAHVAGWDLWKVLPTMISGIAFGYLFLRRGLWAAIVLHFLFDYLGMTAPAMAQWGIQAEGAMNAVYLMATIIGLVLLVHYAVIVLREGRRELRDALAGGRGPGAVARNGNP